MTYDHRQRETSLQKSLPETVTPASLPAVTPPVPQATSTTSGPHPKLTVKNWHRDEQPRERLMTHGAEALATSELLAILLRTGALGHSVVDVARDLLHRCDGSLRGLSRLKYQDIAEAHGIGPAKAVALVAALELGKRWTVEADRDHTLLLGSKVAYEIVAPLLRDLPHEECWVLLTNNASRFIGRERISTGSVDGTIVDVRSVMACALRNNASGFVIAHNHPSHSLNPSQADIHLTNALAEASKLMNLAMQDHIIVAGNRYYSFRDSKLLK